MESLLIKGGVPLHGDVTISGAKNAVLPIMAATLLTAEPCVIRRVPDLSDVAFMVKILQSLGSQMQSCGFHGPLQCEDSITLFSNRVEAPMATLYLHNLPLCGRSGT